MSESRPFGPNMRRLLALKMSQLIVPRGGGGLGGALGSLMTISRLQDASKSAADWLKQVIAELKVQPDNPFGDDEEAIAGDVLRRTWRKMGPLTCPDCGNSRLPLGKDKYHCGRCN